MPFIENFAIRGQEVMLALKPDDTARRERLQSPFLQRRSPSLRRRKTSGIPEADVPSPQRASLPY